MSASAVVSPWLLGVVLLFVSAVCAASWGAWGAGLDRLEGKLLAAASAASALFGTFFLEVFRRRVTGLLAAWGRDAEAPVTGSTPN